MVNKINIGYWMRKDDLAEYSVVSVLCDPLPLHLAEDCIYLCDNRSHGKLHLLHSSLNPL